MLAATWPGHAGTSSPSVLARPVSATTSVTVASRQTIGTSNAPDHHARAPVARPRTCRPPTSCRRSDPPAAGSSCSHRRDALTNSALVATSCRSRSSETPLQVVPSLDHLVTQWISTVNVSDGSSLNSCRDRDTSAVTAPSIVRLQSSTGTCGVGPVDRTGKSSTTYRPGGTRLGSTSRRGRPRKPREMKAIDPGRSAALGTRGQELICESGRERVNGVVEGVDRDLLLGPEDGGRRDVQGREGHLSATPDGRTVRRGGLAGGEAGRVEQPANDAPSGAVAPVGEIVEARLGDRVLERRDAQRLSGRAGGRRAGRPPAEFGLDRA